MDWLILTPYFSFFATFMLALFYPSLTNSYCLITSYNGVKICKRQEVNIRSYAVSALYWKWENCAVGQRDVRHNWWLVCLLMDCGRDWNENFTQLILKSKILFCCTWSQSVGIKAFPLSQTIHFFWQPFKCLCIFKGFIPGKTVTEVSNQPGGHVYI